MEQKIYYVAIATESEIFNPTIVEKFNDRADANNYAALMGRAKHRKYMVLEQTTEWGDIHQEK